MHLMDLIMLILQRKKYENEIIQTLHSWITSSSCRSSSKVKLSLSNIASTKRGNNVKMHLNSNKKRKQWNKKIKLCKFRALGVDNERAERE
jgi:formylmethanofuran dehydrogenase subunit A